VALYSKLKGEKEKALRFVDKALQYDKRHIPAYHLRGSVLLIDCAINSLPPQRIGTVNRLCY
jgi:hypothetical protein